MNFPNYQVVGTFTVVYSFIVYKTIICEKPFSINYSEVKKLGKVMRNQNKIFLKHRYFNLRLSIFDHHSDKLNNS